MTNHLGNVLATISDKKGAVDDGTYLYDLSTGALEKLGSTPDGVLDYYKADVVTANDYYPFGMVMTGRKYSAGSGYRYGFNGKENDNEVKAEGGQQDYGLRVYEPRLGRFLSVDGLTKNYPELTPYQFASNRPIQGVDLDGNEFEDFKKLLADAAKVAKLILSTKDLVAITATVIGETGQGALSLDQQKAVGWVYYNRIARDKNKSVDKGLMGSYAYNRPGKSDLPNVWTMTWMVGLGDEKYKDEGSEGQIKTKTVGELAKTPYAQPFILKAKTLQSALQSEFSKPEFNPHPNYTGQGYHGDLNLNGKGDDMWIQARAYFWLQKDGKVPNDYDHTYVIELRTKGQEFNTTFIFKEKEIPKYFKDHPENLPKDVPLYDYVTDDKSKK